MAVTVWKTTRTQNAMTSGTRDEGPKTPHPTSISNSPISPHLTTPDPSLSHA